MRTEATITVTAPIGAGFEYNINGGTFQTGTSFQVLVQGTYLIRVRNIATGCESPATSTVVNLPQAQPDKPVVIAVEPACPQLNGNITVTSPTGTAIEYSINGSIYQSSGIFTNIAAGNYTVTARFTGTTCVSQITTAVIKGLTPDDCASGPDIYFPSAFTPNGDAVNDGFGPGPKTNLANVTSYSLMLFNRYGEMVFKSNDPFKQWNGTYKGKMLANNSYTWVASYRFNGSPVRSKKGTVLMLR
jgi:gliding motility-associated-like protein